jgi:O-antigen/teichoic acid export membrane protein
MTSGAFPASAAGDGVARRARAGGVAAAVSFVGNLLATLLLVPVLLGAWGAERYGSWLALLSLLGVLTTFDTGHHNYVGNELMRLYPVDRVAARRVLASALLAALCIGALELGVVIVLLSSGALPWALGQAVPLPELAPALLLLAFGWLWQGSLGGVLARLYPALGRYARSVWWGVAYRALSALTLGIGAWLGGGILAVVAASTLMTLLYVAFAARDARRCFGELYPFWRGAEPGLAFRNVARSTVLTGCALVAQLGQHGVLLWLSARGGLGWVPAFTTTRTAANLFLQASAVITGPLLPEMVRFAALGEQRKLAETIRAAWFSSGVPINIGVCLCLPVYEPLYLAWTGGAVPFERALFAWLAVGVSLRAWGAPFVALLGGLNALGAQVWISSVQTALTLGALVIASARLGLEAVGLSLALGELCGSVVLPLLLMKREQPALMQLLPRSAIAIAGAPCLVVATCLLAAARGVLDAPVAAALGVVLSLIAYAASWSSIGRPVRARLLMAVRLGRARASQPPGDGSRSGAR